MMNGLLGEVLWLEVEKDKLMMAKKHILIIYTGGTIGMRVALHGYEPVTGYLQAAMQHLAVLQNADMPNYEIHEYQPLIDSADAEPELWNRIANDIKHHYEQYDGFLILHGTDTMAYTASALSFMLQNLAKPVMLTGSQVSLGLTKTDARENLINALYLLQHYPIPEVTVYFNNYVFRGNRVTKVNASSYDAFNSPNFSALIKMATMVEIQMPISKKEVNAPLIIQVIKPAKFMHITLFPGIDADCLRPLVTALPQAVIIKSYGVGNAPSKNKNLLELLKQLAEKNILLINSSQCLQAKVSMQEYATGQVLFECGAVSAADMTDEAIICKLYYLFSLALSLKDIKRKFMSNLNGELT